MKKINLLLMFVAVILTAATLKAQSYVNPLERWATHNLDGLNTFATGDAATTKGKLYQFGRNVPLNAEGVVAYWGNLPNSGEPQPPYEVGHPGNWRVWHIHLLNSYTAGNWFGNGTTTDTWESIVAQTTALGAPPSGTFPGYEYTVEGYTGTNGGSPAPAGWHLPTYAEMKSLIAVVGSDLLQYTFNQNDYTETYIDVLGNGITANYTADYKSISSSALAALRFKGTNYESAYKYEYINTAGEEALKVSAKSSGGATIDDIAAWTTEWDDAVVRYFPAAGFRTTGVSTIQAPTEGYYWSGGVYGAGTAYCFTFSDSRFRGSGHGGANAYLLRVIKDCDPGPATLTLNKEVDKLQIKTVNGKLIVEGLDLTGKYINVFNMQGRIVYNQYLKLNKLEINLPTGLYVVKVDNKKQKVLIR